PVGRADPHGAHLRLSARRAARRRRAAAHRRQPSRAPALGGGVGPLPELWRHGPPARHPRPLLPLPVAAPRRTTLATARKRGGRMSTELVRPNESAALTSAEHEAALEARDHAIATNDLSKLAPRQRVGLVLAL